MRCMPASTELSARPLVENDPSACKLGLPQPMPVGVCRRRPWCMREKDPRERDNKRSDCIGPPGEKPRRTRLSAVLESTKSARLWFQTTSCLDSKPEIVADHLSARVPVPLAIAVTCISHKTPKEVDARQEVDG